MSNPLDAIFEDLKQLSGRKLEEAASYIRALKSEEDGGVTEEWREALDRRIEEIESGRVQTRSAEAVHTRLDEKLRDARRIPS